MHLLQKKQIKQQFSQLFIVVFIILATTTLANAQDGGSGGNYFISPAIFYNADLQERSAKADSSNLLLDFRGGINVGTNMYVGLLYAMDNKSVKTSGYSSASDNYEDTRKRTSYGPFFAYFIDSFFGMFTYLYDSEWSISSVGTSGTTNTVYDGWGYQLDLGFKFPLWGVQFGPLMSYKYFSYSKITSGSPQALNPEFKETKLDPSLAIWIFF